MSSDGIPSTDSTLSTDGLRAALIAASLALVDKRLVARTWGNLSARVDGKTMLITPSGIPYEKLGPQDLALVDIGTLEWTGSLKPSSEKGLHAMVYSERPQTGAVIHTHQFWASALAAARRGLEAGEGGRADEKAAPCAKYALPTTKALTRAVQEAIAGNDADTVILANHGALCFAENLEAAIALAESLERRARALILDAFRRSSGNERATESDLVAAYAAGNLRRSA